MKTIENLQALLDEAIDACGIVGAQLSVVRGDERIDLAAGFRDHVRKIPMTVDTNVQVGSVTKVLNAALVLEVVARHELDLDEPIVRRIPELELADAEATSRVTLRHLLAMTSGMDNGDYAAYGMDDGALARRIEALANFPQHFMPGESYGYSNASTDLSGYVAQKVTGRRWHDLLQELVAVPAGLNDTGSTDAHRQLSRLSRGHMPDPQTGGYQLIEEDYLSAGSAPAGSVTTSSAHDLASFGKALLDGRIDPANSVFAAETVRGMFEFQVDVPISDYSSHWCLGLGVKTWQGRPIWWHPGGNKCGGSCLFIDPETRSVVAWAFNTVGNGARLNDRLMLAVLTDVFGVSPQAPTPTTLPVDQLDFYCGSYGSMAGEIEVERRGDGLHLTCFAGGGRTPLNTIEGELVPVGDGRFWIKRDGQQAPVALYDEIALFDLKGEGRATNAVRGFLPSSRAHSGASAAPPKQPG